MEIEYVNGENLLISINEEIGKGKGIFWQSILVRAIELFANFCSLNYIVFYCEDLRDIKSIIESNKWTKNKYFLSVRLASQLFSRVVSLAEIRSHDPMT